jgi:hypothetical protein
MKYLLIVCTLILSIPAIHAGGPQINTLAKEQRAPKINLPPPPTFFGIIPKAIQSKQPWQLINPAAPRNYGYGRDMVSWNSTENKPKGFIAFGIRFW